ncbi:MAG: FtsX-like permease family protein [Pseudomonadota bacterium]
MTGPALSAILSHWRRQPGQFLTMILGLALATALWTGVQAINAEARASYDRAAGALGGGTVDVFLRDGVGFQDADFVALRRAGWRVSPVIEGWIAAERGRVRLIGLDPLTAPPGTEAAAIAIGDPSDFLTGSGQILAAPATVDRLGTVPLDAVSARGLAPGFAFADIGIAQRLLDRPGEIDRMLIHPDQPMGLPDPAEIVPGITREEPQTAADLARLTDSFHLNLTAFGFLSFAVGLFIVNGAVGLAFEQRRVVFRTLRTLGLPVSTLIALLLAELLAIALVAGILGVGLGYLIAAALLPDVAATLRGLYGANVEGTLSISPLWWAAGLLIAFLGTAIAATGTLWKVARLPLLAPARPRAWARASMAALRWQLAASGLLAVLAVGAGFLGTGLIGGFALLGALLLAAALALPGLLSGALALGAHFAKRPLAQWFWADTGQQLPGLSLALMALLLALAANIGVGTMVSSFRLTFLGWLDQRLAAELYVTVESPAQAAALLEWADGRATALPNWQTDTVIAGAPGEVLTAADHATYRDHWPLLDALPDAWDAVASGTAAMVNEQLARREGLRPGDMVDLPGGPVTLAGIYSDYGNPKGQVLIAPDAFAGRFPDAPRQSFGLRVAPGEVAAIRESLATEIGLSPQRILEQGEIKRVSRQVFEQTFTVTGALNTLTLSVAGFAILTSLLTLANMRLPGLAPVWALGLTRAQLARIELVRAMLLALLTAIVALPVGLILAWVLLAVINVEAFGWKLPMYLFPGQWAALGGAAMGAALLAGLWPARRLARRPAADLIKVFAHER